VWTTIKDIARRRDLLAELVRKEIKLRYKRSALGVLWSLLHPLLMMGIFTLVFSRFPRLSGTPVPYYVFFMTGYLPWVFFATTVSNAQGSILVNAALVKQVFFPRQLLPLAACLSNLLHFGIAFGIWLAFLAATHMAVTPALLLVPVALAIQFALLVGIALALSALNVSFRDVGQILDVLITFLFYLTPVFYTYAIFPPADAWIVRLLALNPMAQIIQIYRGALLPGFAVTPFMIAYPAAFALGVLALGHAVFARASRDFAKEL
jgi:ABC-type polysaccharide/polyol phosphate export permease